MNDRRKFLVVLGAAGFAPCVLVAQPKQTPERAGKPVRVSLLAATTSAMFQLQEKAFVETMRELGWAEGRNVVYDRVYADDDPARLPALAAALVSRGPNLVYVGSTETALAVFAKTRTIPIVFGAASDPVDNGLVQSLAHPGGNVTGVTNIGWELGGKRLQLLKQALPRITRVGVLVDPGWMHSAREQQLIEQAGAALGVTVIAAMAKEGKELDAAIASLAKSRTEALLTTTTSLFLRERKRILELAAKQRIPVVGHRGQFVEEGALMSYGARITDQIRRAAQMVDKVLKGTKPADIPVEQPTRFELVVNMKTAKALGISIPQSIILQADRVIE